MNKYFTLSILFFLVYNVVFFLFFFRIITLCKYGIITTGILLGTGASSGIASLAFLMLSDY